MSARAAAADFDLCRRVTHSRGANFSLGFRFLRSTKRRAVYAAYAFCRYADDLADEAGVANREAALDAWEAELHAAYGGRPRHPVSRALAATLEEFPIPKAAFAALIAGCRRDQVQTRYPTFADLELYCEEVAVSISDISLAIFGALDRRARTYGRHLALGLQLTNVLRDVREDLERGRVYVPQDELARFGVAEADLARGLAAPGVRDLLAFQAARARERFRAARPLLDCLEPDARRPVALMGSVYAAVLAKIERRGYDVFSGRVGLSLPEKLAVVGRGLLRPRLVT